MEIRAVWDRLERWLAANAPPELLASLGPAASEDEIVRFEEALAITLPDDVRASYRIHDGQLAATTGRVDRLIGGRHLLSLDGMRHEWTVWEEILDSGAFNGFAGEPNGNVRSDWWHPRWIPITDDDTGSHDCLDLAPAPGGTVGQVISFRNDVRDRIVRAPSFTAWLDAYVSACEDGRYAYSAVAGGFAGVSR